MTSNDSVEKYLNRAIKAFGALFAGKQRIREAGPQTVGCERYRLIFSGAQYGEANEALHDLAVTIRRLYTYKTSAGESTTSGIIDPTAILSDYDLQCKIDSCRDRMVLVALQELQARRTGATVETSSMLCEMEQEGESHDLRPGVVCLACYNRVSRKAVDTRGALEERILTALAHIEVEDVPQAVRVLRGAIGLPEKDICICAGLMPGFKNRCPIHGSDKTSGRWCPSASHWLVEGMSCNCAEPKSADHNGPLCDHGIPRQFFTGMHASRSARQDEGPPGSWICGACDDFNFPDDMTCVHCGEGTKPAPMTEVREWKFDRYRYGKLMAEGVTVHAATESEAREIAESLKPYFADRLTLREKTS